MILQKVLLPNVGMELEDDDDSSERERARSVTCPYVSAHRGEYGPLAIIRGLFFFGVYLFSGPQLRVTLGAFTITGTGLPHIAVGSERVFFFLTKKEN